VFAPIETLFLDGPDQFAVTDEGDGCVAVVSVDTQDVHMKPASIEDIDELCRDDDIAVDHPGA
jgi:uncharacterized protein YjiK